MISWQFIDYRTVLPQFPLLSFKASDMKRGRATRPAGPDFFVSEELESKDNRASLKRSKMSERLVPLNGDGSKEQRLQGLTSVGIRDAAHQASRGAE